MGSLVGLAVRVAAAPEGALAALAVAAAVQETPMERALAATLGVGAAASGASSMADLLAAERMMGRMAAVAADSAGLFSITMAASSQ